MNVTQAKSLFEMFRPPNVGMKMCFVQKESHGVYLHLPIFVLMILNIILFFITIISLYR